MAARAKKENRQSFKEGDGGWVFPSYSLKSKACPLCEALGLPAHEAGKVMHVAEGKVQRIDKKTGKAEQILPSPHRLRDTYTSALVEVGGISPFAKVCSRTTGRRVARLLRATSISR